MSARALEQAIEHPDVYMAAAPAGKDTVGVVEDTGEKQRKIIIIIKSYTAGFPSLAAMRSFYSLLMYRKPYLAAG